MFEEVSTGAADDLQRATEIGHEMVVRYGMVHALGQRTYAPPRQQFLGIAPIERGEISEETEREIDVAVKEIVDHAFDRATQVLRGRQRDLDEGARLLLEKETLTADEFPAIRLPGLPAPSPVPAP